MYTKFDLYFGILSGGLVLIFTILNIFFFDIHNYDLYESYFIKTAPIIVIITIIRYIVAPEKQTNIP